MPRRCPFFFTVLRAAAFVGLVLASVAIGARPALDNGSPSAEVREGRHATIDQAPHSARASRQRANAPGISTAFTPAAVAPGEHSTLTITLANPDLDTPVPGANVVNELPAPLQLIQAAHTCGGGALAAAVGSSRLQLYSATIPPGGCTITAEVAWPRTADGIKACATASLVTNAIAPGPAPGGNRFSTAAGQVDAPAFATLGCFLARHTLSQVPTLGDWARTALAGLMVLLGVVLAGRRMPPR